ncbi:MAG: ATP-binding protein [Acidaminococcaceae bacterium]
MNYLKYVKEHKLKDFTLSQTIVLLIIFAIFVSLFATSTLISRKIPNMVDERLDINALRVTSVMALSKETKTLLINKDYTALNAVVASVSSATNSSIAIFDRNRVLLMAYNPAGIKNFEQQAQQIAFESIDYSGILDMAPFTYSTGAASAITNQKDELIGYVAVAYPSNLSDSLINEIMLLILLAGLIGLSVGTIGAVYLAKKIKTTLFDLEPPEIAALLQERVTLLNTVKDGVIAVDATAKIYLINTEGLRLLSMAGIKNAQNLIGKNIDLLINYDNINKVLMSKNPLLDLTSNINGFSIIYNIIPVFASNLITGVIITFREKTAVEELAKQLTGVRNYADALRAQTHEFMNKMHVITGLLEMQAYDDLKKYLRQLANTRHEETSFIASRLNDPALTGFMLGKISRARELNIELSLSEESELKLDQVNNVTIHDIILYIGNLLENAFDALTDWKGERLVNLAVLTFEDELIITVEDTGPGIKKTALESIFIKKFSTKGETHGFGLYLIKNNLASINGTIEVESSENNGATFTIKIPLKRMVTIDDQSTCC